MKDLKTFINEGTQSYKIISSESMEGFKRILTPCVDYNGEFGVIIGQAFQWHPNGNVDKKIFKRALDLAKLLGYDSPVTSYEKIESWWEDCSGDTIDEGQVMCFACIGDDEAFSLFSYGGDGVIGIK